MKTPIEALRDLIALVDIGKESLIDWNAAREVLTRAEAQPAAKPQKCECKTDAEIGLCAKPCERDATPTQPAAEPEAASPEYQAGWNRAMAICIEAKAAQPTAEPDK
jgi:hypothetical protein